MVAVCILSFPMGLNHGLLVFQSMSSLPSGQNQEKEKNTQCVFCSFCLLCAFWPGSNRDTYKPQDSIDSTGIWEALSFYVHCSLYHLSHSPLLYATTIFESCTGHLLTKPLMMHIYYNVIMYTMTTVDVSHNA